MAEIPSAHNSFFAAEGDVYTPLSLARSPWRADHQNGVAIGSLLAHTMLHAEPPQDMNVARFTLDMLRPAHMAPTRAKWRCLREGRRTRVLDGSLVVGDVEVARASALFVRRGLDQTPATEFATPTPTPEEAPGALEKLLSNGLESRLVQRGTAGYAEPPGRIWVRPSCAVVEGAAGHPVISAVLAAEFGGRILSGIDRNALSSTNVDVAVHFWRSPRDEWILVEAQTLLLGNGVGLVNSRMSDRYGEFGSSHLTLFIAATAPNRLTGAI